MKYENVEMLGNYSLRNGGDITISMGKNLELGTELNTYVHEQSHMYLTNSSMLGFLLNILEMECTLASIAKDDLHYNKVRDLFVTIFQRTIDVQEIFANNQELLWIEENIGSEFKKRTFKMKPPKYQKYYNKMSVITNDGNLSFSAKKYWVYKLCLNAMNINIFSNEFISSLKSKQKISYYFSQENHPNKRLEEAIKKYSESEDFKDEIEIRFTEFISQLNKQDTLIYFVDRFPDLDEVESKFKLGNLKNGETIESFIEYRQKTMDEKVKLFDFNNLRTLRVENISSYLDYGVFVIKNCGNITNEENFYLITKETMGSNRRYISGEAPCNSLHSEEIKFIGISHHEYDTDKMAPRYLGEKNVPLVVLIDNYADAKEVIEKILNDGELFIGDLYDQNVNNFFTALFFRERTEPKTIFIFPTLKKLSLMLLKELEIADLIVYSNDSHFKKILSTFRKEIEIVKFTQWIYSFILESIGDFANLDDPATKMNIDLIASSLKDEFKFRIPDYYEQLAALPTKKTVGEPFYTLMNFEDNRNTGAFNEVRSNTIAFFESKEDASFFRTMRTQKIPGSTFEVVGVDKHYWNTVKPKFNKGVIKVCIVLDVKENLAELVDLVDIDNIINN